jgi:hypothetical protein
MNFPTLLWWSRLNILFIHRSVLLWHQSKTIKSVIVGGRNLPKPLVSKMRQIFLGINQSSAYVFPSFHSYTLAFLTFFTNPGSGVGERVHGAEMAVEQAGAYSHFYGEEPEKT